MRLLVALSMLAVLVLAACSDDGGGSESDYIEGLRDIRQIDFASDDDGQEFDSALISREFKDLADRWDDLNPPESLTEWHDSYVDVLREASDAILEVETVEELSESDAEAVETFRLVDPMYDIWADAFGALYGFRFYSVGDASMEPSFQAEQELEPTNYTGQAIDRGMSIIFRFHMSTVFRFHLDGRRDFFKRVIGLPGETVEVRDGVVFIDGAALVEDYILAPPDYAYGPKTVPADQYFVLGDNRHDSFDSHIWGQRCPGLDCEFVLQANILGVLAKDGKPLGE